MRSSSISVVGEGVERQRGRAPRAAREAGVTVGDLGPRERDDEDRVVPAPVEQVLDERDQTLVGPVDVLEDHRERAPLGEPLEEAAPRREQILAVRRRPVGQPEEVEEARLDPGPLIRVLDVELEHRGQLRGGARLRLVLEDPRATSHHLGEGPVGDAVAVGEAAAAMPPDLADEPVDVLLELPRQPRLADACDADDRDEPGAGLVGAGVEEILEQPELGRAADERRLERAAAPLAAAVRDDPERPEAAARARPCP